MDLRVYFQKLKQTEALIDAAHVLVISNETSDGGRPGIATEVVKEVAAKLIVETKARLANEEETELFNVQKAKAKEDIDRSTLADRVQLTVVSDTDLKAIKNVLKTRKD